MADSKPEKKKRKTKVYYVDEQKHKISRLYLGAKRSDKRGICEQYNISGSAVLNWISQGFGKIEAPKPKARTSADTAAALAEMLIDSFEAGQISIGYLRTAIPALILDVSKNAGGDA